VSKVEGVRWDDLDDATAAIFSSMEKESSVRGRQSPLDSFDLDGSLSLVARLQKAAAAADEEPTPPAPPFEKKDEPEAEEDEPAEEDKDEPEEDEEAEKVAAAAVMRQTLVDVCSLLAGEEPELDKTAGVIALGLLDGHPGSEIGDFVSGMDKVALELPWQDLPEEGLATNIRRAFHRTPEEKLLQSEANYARSSAKAQQVADTLDLKNQALNLERAAKHAPADALHRSSQIRGLMEAGLDRPTAERTLQDQADRAAKGALSTARKSMGLDKGKVPVSFGGVSANVNKRLFTRTAPLALAALGGGYMLGRGRDRDRERPRGITIS